VLQRRKFRKGQVLVKFGDPAGELFLLARGKASVTVTLASGGQKRLATFSPGMAFGEMAMLDQAPRSAIVTADTEVECDLLTVADFERLGQTQPALNIGLLRNLALGLYRKLRKANREISVFDY
jgi:glutaminase